MTSEYTQKLDALVAEAAAIVDPPMSCGCTAHPLGAKFYATVKRTPEGASWAVLAGPFDTHQEALDALPEATRWAYSRDARAPWYSYGTASMTAPFPKSLMTH